MLRVLLTNDDGVDAPALAPFARALEALGAVTVVVPDRERSWVGKAISRVDEVVVARTDRDGVAVTTCSGFPADAVQLGVHVIVDPAPDLVVSGINIGYNHGAAFLLSSGTVGAAIEGWITGLPAIAFSTGPSNGDYESWRRHARSPEAKPRWRALAETCATVLSDVRDAGLFERADVVSVNLPFDATADTPRRLTRVARVRYDQLLHPVAPGRYRHCFGTLTPRDDLAGTDVGAADEGIVSITPLRLPDAVAVPEVVRDRVERNGSK